MKTLALGKLGTLLVMLAIVTQLGMKSAAGQSEGQALHIFVGKSVVVNVQAPVTRILSSNPAVIDTIATSTTQVVVEGKAAGVSSLILWDSSGHSQMLDVTVDVNVATLRSAIEQQYPGQQIAVQSDGAHLVLTGTVSDSKIADDIVKMATSYSPSVVNSLMVAPVHEQEVLLEVKFAEVDRSKERQLGINILSTGAANTPGTISTQQFGPPSVTGQLTGVIGGNNVGFTTSFQLSNLLNIFLFRPDLNLGATIQDLESKSVLQILAEPNLLALSGQKASFLAGGEFPVPVVQGGQSVGVVTIQFRPFGVRLDFTSFVGKDNVIRLHIAPEVSTLDFANAATISGFRVPALSTRRAETEIELKNGQSFGIAGLLDNRAQVQMSKIPGIGDIPILGNLFRSKDVTRSNTELVVLVTPHIVDPINMNTPPPPTPQNPIQFLEHGGFDKNLPSKTEPEKPQATEKTPSSK
jgi:pilus assembly protein CpaC